LFLIKYRLIRFSYKKLKKNLQNVAHRHNV
jgi:hypothetical protein